MVPFSDEKNQVCAIDVALNEKREEISRLEAEIRCDQPEILQMTNSELRQLNDHLAEDLRILVRKFPTSPSVPPSQAVDKLFSNQLLCSANQLPLQATS